MKNNERTVTIVKVERLGTSVYGNPYYRLHLHDGTSLRTQINAMINFGIENSSNLNRPVVLTTTKAGRVYDIRLHEGTPIKFERGNIVKAHVGAGVVTEVDHEHAQTGGMMIYRVAMIENGAVESVLWYRNEDLTRIDIEA